MAFETKVILESVLNQVALAKDLEQAYALIAGMAKVEGMVVPSYNDKRSELGVDGEGTNCEKK